MPSVISLSLKAHLANSTLNLAVCCKVTRLDGVVFGFTNHVRGLFINGIKYRAGSGMTPSALEAQDTMEVDNAEIQWAFADDQISQHDLRGGVFDGAIIEFFIVNYYRPQSGILKGPKGEFGQVKISDNETCVVEFRSLSQKAKQLIGNQTGETCRCKRLGAGLTDPMELCEFNLNGNTKTGYKARQNAWVTISASRRAFFCNLSNTFETDASRANSYSWETVTWGRDLSNKKTIDYRELPVESFNGTRFVLSPNENISDNKKPKIGDTGIAHAVKVSDGSLHDFNFTVTSIRQEFNGAYSFGVQSGFFGVVPDHNEGAIPNGFFNNGIIKWLTGANAGIEREVMEHDGQAISLQEPMPFDILANDSFSIEVGCDRTIDMCYDTFDQAINFDGEPDIKPYEEVTAIEGK